MRTFHLTAFRKILLSHFMMTAFSSYYKDYHNIVLKPHSLVYVALFITLSGELKLLKLPQFMTSYFNTKVIQTRLHYIIFTDLEIKVGFVFMCINLWKMKLRKYKLSILYIVNDKYVYLMYKVRKCCT